MTGDCAGLPYLVSPDCQHFQSSSMRAVPRRARQNKSPAQRGLARHPERKVWNIESQPFPNISRVPISDNQVFKVVQTADLGVVLSTSNLGTTAAGINFQLTNVPNKSDWEAAFDQYRITEIEVWLYLSSSNNGGHQGTLYSAVDYDSASTTLLPSQLAEYSNVIIAPVSTIGHYHKFRPGVAVAAYSGAFTSYAHELSPWIDCTSDTVQHYGVVLACSVTTDNALPVQAQVRYHLEFKNIR